ncbi:MAG: nucleotidyltransferase domain-containing protein [Deltaproteobacteria bacterium]
MEKNTEKVISNIVELLKKGYKPEKVILFGSYAWGSPTEESDIDILIIKNTKAGFFKRLLDVRKIVSEARRGYAFEPIVLTPKELNERLKGHDRFFETILNKGKLLYAA